MPGVRRRRRHPDRRAARLARLARDRRRAARARADRRRARASSSSPARRGRHRRSPQTPDARGDAVAPSRDARARRRGRARRPTGPPRRRRPPAPEGGGTPPAAGLAEWPEGRTAWTVVLNSSGTREDAERLGRRAGRQGRPGRRRARLERLRVARPRLVRGLRTVPPARSDAGRSDRMMGTGAVEGRAAAAPSRQTSGTFSLNQRLGLGDPAYGTHGHEAPNR